MWGCDKPTQAAVWADDEDEFYTCPLRFLTDEVVVWYSEYSYNKELGGAKPYANQSKRFIDAMFLYNKYYNEYYREVLKSKQSPSSTEAGLSKLKTAFNIKRRQDG